jgi:hypothetical protein
MSTKVYKVERFDSTDNQCRRIGSCPRHGVCTKIDEVDAESGHRVSSRTAGQGIPYNP